VTVLEKTQIPTEDPEFSQVLEQIVRCCQATAFKLPTFTSAKYGRELNVTAYVSGRRSDVTLMDAVNRRRAALHYSDALRHSVRDLRFPSILASIIGGKKHMSRRIVSTEHSGHYMYRQV
jgi:hypothetical protein